MADANNTFSPDASAVLALMKSFNGQRSALPPISADANNARETEESKNRLLAAAMSILSASGGNPPAWLSEPQMALSNAKADLSANWDEVSLTSQFFPGLVTASSETVSSPHGDYSFPNAFMMLPPGLQSMAAKGLPPLVNGSKNEDFCELCQKHFCNKYYLRKHKSDVHRIASEPLAQLRKRESGLGEPEEAEPSDKSPSTSASEWMSVLTSSAATAQQLGESAPNRSPPIEAFCGSSTPGETIAPSEKEQVSLWTAKSEAKPSRVELSENATFIPPVAVADPVASPVLTSSAGSKQLNVGALDMFKSSMAAAKLADRVTCELCKKELCNKYFLRTHKIKVHGLSPQEVGGPVSRSAASKHAEKAQSEGAGQGLEGFGVPPPLPPPLSLMTPMLPSQFPAPLGSLSSWMPPQPSSIMPEAPKPSQEEAKKDPVLQLMAANALVTCPLCDKTIGPRLFLPTHLTSVHSLSPTDPSFFIFILSARTLDNNGENESSTIKLTPPATSERGSPTSTHFQLPNAPFLRLPSSTSVEAVNREQPGSAQFGVPNTVNGMLPQPISMNEVGLGGGGFDLPVMATASTTPLLLPPPLGLLSTPPGLYPAPPSMQPPPAPAPPTAPATGMMTSPTTATATAAKWNSVHLAATGLTAKRVMANGSTGTTPRKSPNQMRVLCDICNKWICNKYFLRTHKANKHGITDQSPMLAPTPQAAGGPMKGAAAVPLDFSKPGKMLHQPPQQPFPGLSEGAAELFPMGPVGGKEEPPSVHPPLMTPWSFATVKSHSPISKSPQLLTPPAERVDPDGICENSADRGCPLNLSLKPVPQSARGAEIKHGVCQFLTHFTSVVRGRRNLKVRRRSLRLRKRAAIVLAGAHRQFCALQRPSLRTKRHPANISSVRTEAAAERDGKDVPRRCLNVCQVCNVCFNKLSQLEAHCYDTDHRRIQRGGLPRSDEILLASTNAYRLPDDPVSQNAAAPMASDFSVGEVAGWWTRQQKWPINFAPSKLKSHQSSSGNTSATEQFCSYQASHHMLQSTLFGETTTTPSI